jgi:maleate isomerase
MDALIKQVDMQALTYVEEDYLGAAPRVGLIILQSDEVIENELRFWLPPGTAIFHTRIPSSVNVTPETLAAMEKSLVPAATLLPRRGEMSVVAYCCTSGTTVIGEEKVKAAIRSVWPEVEVTNPFTAVKANLHALGIRRIGLLTPYEPAVARTVAEHLANAGFDIVSCGSFFELREAKVTRISRKSILDAMEAIGSDPDCEAVFASCTNLRTAGLLEEAIERLGKPVISSNSALAFHITQLSALTPAAK